MSKSIPTIQKYMTVTPHTLGFDQTVEQAQEMMSKYKIRHLPILKGGKLVGILSDRDVKLMMSFADANPREMKVEDAYTPDPYITTPTARLDEVVTLMAEKNMDQHL